MQRLLSTNSDPIKTRALANTDTGQCRKERRRRRWRGWRKRTSYLPCETLQQTLCMLHLIQLSWLCHGVLFSSCKRGNGEEAMHPRPASWRVGGLRFEFRSLLSSKCLLLHMASKCRKEGWEENSKINFHCKTLKARSLLFVWAQWGSSILPPGWVIV